MTSIVQLWRSNRDFFSQKKLQQIIGFAGEGELRDGNSTSAEFREFLSLVSDNFLASYADECLQESFNDSGLALQDIVNEIGSRLGFEVTNGVYRGRSGGIGCAGIWRATDEHAIVVEVKTTDAYRINLDDLARYRKRLIDSDNSVTEKSSILIVVGRKDTGDLEAQIRGSRHAWDIRLVSVDALLNLLSLRGKLNDPRTTHQINEVFRPTEYTRIDKLIELIFVTAQDRSLELDEDGIESTDSGAISDDLSDIEMSGAESPKQRDKPANFHADCLDKIEQHLAVKLIKKSRSTYANRDKTVGLCLAVSKLHRSGSTSKYWFAYHPYQREFLETFKTAYLGFGCGSGKIIILIPFDVFDPLCPSLRATEKEGKIRHWHIFIYDRGDRCELQIPKQNSFLNLEAYRLPLVPPASPTRCLE